MPNSSTTDSTDAPREFPPDPPIPDERTLDARLDAIRQWVAYIDNHPPEVWGPQQNAVVNAQIEAARNTDIPLRSRDDRRETPPDRGGGVR